MCDFWSNHFNIWRQHSYLQFLRNRDNETVIRPHALGKFKDMLHASAHSPAMMDYLDNRSSNASSPGGVNQNYARELLELHTLGIINGTQVYNEADVQACAQIMSRLVDRVGQRSHQVRLQVPGLHARPPRGQCVRRRDQLPGPRERSGLRRRPRPPELPGAPLGDGEVHRLQARAPVRLRQPADGPRELGGRGVHAPTTRRSCRRCATSSRAASSRRRASPRSDAPTSTWSRRCVPSGRPTASNPNGKSADAMRRALERHGSAAPRARDTRRVPRHRPVVDLVQRPARAMGGRRPHRPQPDGRRVGPRRPRADRHPGVAARRAACRPWPG